MKTGQSFRRRGVSFLLCGGTAVLSACSQTPSARVDSLVAPLAMSDQCSRLAGQITAKAPVQGIVIKQASWVPAGISASAPDGATAALPAHCLVEGYFAERPGTVGGPYRIGFRMRLPEVWNRRFFFQGGGGSNGVVADATGFNGAGNNPALARGYAVIAQDSGHDNDLNNLPSHQGNLVFGFDPEARRNYGHASLKLTSDLGHFLISAFYGQDSQKNFFWGCSKGGQEGMAFAQRYPDEFDGIVAVAPGMSLPRAAVSQAWDTQSFARIFAARGETPTVQGFKSLFSASQLQLVADSALAACDGLDGARDGLIGAVGQCTTARVEPELRRNQCSPAQSGTCLDGAQIDALVRVMDGPKDAAGRQIYAPFAWDQGIAAPGWAVWKLGLENGPPSLNVVLGGGSLAAVFTTPPTTLSGDPQALLEWQLKWDISKGANAIYAVAPPFQSSAWQDIGMRSPDLSAFRAAGGKLIVPHGASDPVFSVLDTIDWWQEVDARERGRANEFIRVFPVPGMNHCGGGPATDRFDSLSALERWVDAGIAPASIPATAGAATPWPGRQMPLCPYPEIAVKGTDASYRCERRP